jgi:ubiquinone/menaquinone biosynthesis C-methylase UbiE
MVASRRSVGIHEPSEWVFNRIAAVYDGRPPYPTLLIDALAELAKPGARILDVGAGTGHLALPLSARGFDVVAVEPAEAMLARLRDAAATLGTRVTSIHAAAETLPLEDRSADLIVVADAVHFIDAELGGRELARVLRPGGAMAIITSEPADTPFMNAVVRTMEEAAPRRPRDMSRAIVQFLSMATTKTLPTRVFIDETPVDDAALTRILASISFIGPAMNEARTAAFVEKLRALPGPRIWARKLSLLAGRRGR